MLSLTYSYRIYPDLTTEARMLAWMEQCRRVYNYALAERKDWSNSRKCAVNACSIVREYIIPADTPYSDYYKQQNALTLAKESILELQDVQSQVLQDALKRLDKAFKFMKERGFGFPRVKKYGQYRSFVFPQFKSNPVTGCQIKAYQDWSSTNHPASTNPRWVCSQASTGGEKGVWMVCPTDTASRYLRFTNFVKMAKLPHQF